MLFIQTDIDAQWADEKIELELKSTVVEFAPWYRLRCAWRFISNFV